MGYNYIVCWYITILFDYNFEYISFPLNSVMYSIDSRNVSALGNDLKHIGIIWILKKNYRNRLL